MNPLTLPFYPPFVSPRSEVLPSHCEYQILHPDDDSPPLSSSAESQQWTAVDHKFRKALPDTWYFKRASYRAVLLQTVPTLVSLDGIRCERERPKLARVLDKLEQRRRQG